METGETVETDIKDSRKENENTKKAAKGREEE